MIERNRLGSDNFTPKIIRIRKISLKTSIKKEKYLDDIKINISNIKSFKNSIQQKEIINILDLALEELNYCSNIEGFVCI